MGVMSMGAYQPYQPSLKFSSQNRANTLTSEEAKKLMEKSQQINDLLVKDTPGNELEKTKDKIRDKSTLYSTIAIVGALGLGLAGGAVILPGKAFIKQLDDRKAIEQGASTETMEENEIEETFAFAALVSGGIFGYATVRSVIATLAITFKDFEKHSKLNKTKLLLKQPSEPKEQKLVKALNALIIAYTTQVSDKMKAAYDLEWDIKKQVDTSFGGRDQIPDGKKIADFLKYKVYQHILSEQGEKRWAVDSPIEETGFLKRVLIQAQLSKINNTLLMSDEEQITNEQTVNTFVEILKLYFQEEDKINWQVGRYEKMVHLQDKRSKIARELSEEIKNQQAELNQQLAEAKGDLPATTNLIKSLLDNSAVLNLHSKAVNQAD